MFLAFNVEEVLESLPIDFRILMIIGALVSSITAIIPMFWKPFCLNMKQLGYFQF